MRLAGLAGMVAASILMPSLGIAKAPPPMDTPAVTVSRGGLPPEAVATERLIRAGGPFPHAKDGAVFGNRERLLPSRPRGWWREYTVRTPGARDRGARRIVCGGVPPTAPETCFYTDDHYASFRRIVQ